ncbi:hypothetical protein TPHA_0E02150 [Tetrapisispora phaffii CBS 4417]|uniref:Uncharacterized protein n=1 Tax=Tetrapisispora phaffii (strain ATCC 24235 / CBS 4417 / NBRC 1672 / NRRL Y-8282 / UCD 70-5) TaxID=1071381 RepID=G8BTS9_TETPH|nr:hypothetical protein TPHA_0E02150 [Tetrapisispora phaffii CBS 4417]CCE63307.1 hypothetical protein TPHA_0E02150 [Tetrapisispora phaffii CBS 4417]
MPSISVDYCLFDLDGTIVSTTIAAERTWRSYCSKHGVDPEELFRVSHGSRTNEMLSRFFPNIDNTDNKAVKELELDLATNHLDTVTLIKGAEDLLLSLDKDTETGKPLKSRKWAIITSGSPYLAFSWFDSILKHVGKPDVFVTGFDVKVGKPDPEGYKKAAVELSEIWEKPAEDISKLQTVVFEDAPVGIMAGKAMGAKTIGITSSYDKSVLFEAGADYVVSDLRQVRVTQNSNDGKIILEITNPLSRD